MMNEGYKSQKDKEIFYGHLILLMQDYSKYLIMRFKMKVDIGRSSNALFTGNQGYFHAVWRVLRHLSFLQSVICRP